MTKLFAAIAGLTIAGSVNAYDATYIYNGTQKDNPDLYNGYFASTSSSNEGLDLRDGLRSSGTSSNMLTSYDVFVMKNPDIDTGLRYAKPAIGEMPGIGDRTDSTGESTAVTVTSYDNWVRGNPDQESSF